MITYKGVEYPTRTFKMYSDETGEVVYTIANTILQKELLGEGYQEDMEKIEREIDEQIYFYVDELELDLPPEEICMNCLDIEFIFVEEIF